ncbi:AraC family transcriptional regulator [Acidocella sp. MX-AZ03]|nr:AraC family transcriptional regulator ligand-binding domain-containing protein [Acidocella sp. MX-AZ03]WBO59360.1 AraC family transcriptional regulator [Acidocella sp. MX-AZ03]
MGLGAGGVPRVALCATAGLLPLLQDLGTDADRVFGPAGVDASGLRADSEGGLALSSYVEVMERAALLSGRADFGLLYGRDFPASSHGLVGDLALAAPASARRCGS